MALSSPEQNSPLLRDDKLGLRLLHWRQVSVSVSCDPEGGLHVEVVGGLGRSCRAGSGLHGGVPSGGLHGSRYEVGEEGANLAAIGGQAGWDFLRSGLIGAVVWAVYMGKCSRQR